MLPQPSQIDRCIHETGVTACLASIPASVSIDIIARTRWWRGTSARGATLAPVRDGIEPYADQASETAARIPRGGRCRAMNGNLEPRRHLSRGQEVVVIAGLVSD